MLCHTSIQWDIVILAPATERMEQQDWISVAKCEKFFAGVVEEKHMAIVEWVSDLEGINSISVFKFNLLLNLRWSQSVFVQTIVESNSLCEAGCSRDKEVSLCDDCCSFGVILGPGSECPRADLFFPVVKEDWIADNCEDIVADCTTSECNRGLTF